MFATDVTVKRDRTYLRSGKGSYCKVLTQVPINTKLRIIEQDDTWLQVSYNAQTGYISETSTQEQKPRNDAFAKMSKTTGSTVSKHSISAGVKGFGEKFSSDFKGNSRFIDIALNDQIDQDMYMKFYNTTYADANPKSFRKTFQLTKRTEPDFYSEAQEGFGLGIASVIAAQGIYQNDAIQKYVNYVGNIVVDASDVPDISFKFYVLDIPAANAYACPGGYIFVTKGMLGVIQNEAELAFVLAHEIAHVSGFHGIIEAKKRENHIAAEDAFDMLDEETPDAFSDSGKETESELEAEIYSMFETLIEGRLDQYEQEADRNGILYMARSGYNPQSAFELLQRLYQQSPKSNNQHYRPDSIRDRLSVVKKSVLPYSGTRLRFFDFKDRWQTNTRRL